MRNPVFPIGSYVKVASKDSLADGQAGIVRNFTETNGSYLYQVQTCGCCIPLWEEDLTSFDPVRELTQAALRAKHGLISVKDVSELFSEGLYYVYNSEDAQRGWPGGCILWWRTNGCGYTSDLSDAGIYTELDREKNYPPKTCVWIPAAKAWTALKPMLFVFDRSLR